VTNSVRSVTSSVASLGVNAPAVAPSITTQPASATVTAGSGVTFTVAASGDAPLSYQWQKDGTAISGATSASYTIASAQTGDAGSFTCVVTNSAGSATSNAATLTVNVSNTGGGGTSTPAAQLINLSVRVQAGGAAGTPITGFVVDGSGSGKRMLIRAIGPTLTSFGVAGALADPQLQLWSHGQMIGSNDNWEAADASVFDAVQAFGLTPGSADAAIVTTLAPGAYSTPVLEPSGTQGNVMIECYDAATSDTSVQLINASALALVGTGDSVLIPGFVISGSGTIKLLVRAVGPQLSQFGVAGVLADPQITVYHGSTVIETNDNWSDSAHASDISSAATQVQAFPLPSGSKDAAVLVTLPEGLYSAVVSGVGNTTGKALVELYVVK
jgi:hypothetical protein